MEFRTIHEGLAVSPQISADDVAQIKRRGYRAIICNRPDGEASGQPHHGDIERAARAEGLDFRYLPVLPGQATNEDARAFRQLLREIPSPVLAYCRTGARSTMLWSMSG